MADEPATTGGWLPPRAPGAEPPQRYESEPGWVPPQPVDPPASAPTPAPASFWTPRTGQPQRAPSPAFARGTPARNGLALTSLVLGILGATLIVLTFGLGFAFALPCSIAAWICGAQARNRINLGETTAGRGQAQAGYLLGIVGVVLGVMAAAGWIAFLAAGGSFDDLREDLERNTNPDAREALVHAARGLFGR
jgi:hypothetical protein